MSIYQLKPVDSPHSYIYKFIEQDNTDTTALAKNRNNETLTVTYTKTDSLFALVNGRTTEHIRHDSETSNVSQLTTVADKHNFPVFAYEHNKHGSDEKWVSVNWYDKTTARWKVKTFIGKTPLLLTDEHRDHLLENAEVILYYVDNSNNLSYFIQSDGFTASAVSAKLRKNERLVKIGLTKSNRIQLETIRPVTEITYTPLLGVHGLPILDKDRNPIWVGYHHPIN